MQIKYQWIVVLSFQLYSFVYSQTVAGPNNPGSAVNVNCSFAFGAPVNYSPPNNVFTSNNLYASATHCPCCDTNTGCLYVSNFGFSIPSGAVITGIRVEIEKQASLGSNVQDNGIRLSKAGVEVGSNYMNTTPWPALDSYITYGGCNDLWGTTWTPADINDPGFGVYFASIDYSCAGTIISRIDHIRISVCYNITLPVYDYKMFIIPQNNSIKIKIKNNYNSINNFTLRLSVLEPGDHQYKTLKNWKANDMAESDSVIFMSHSNGFYHFKLSAIMPENNDEIIISSDKYEYKKDFFYNYLKDENVIILYNKKGLQKLKILEISGRVIYEFDLINLTDNLLSIPSSLKGLHIFQFENENGQIIVSKLINN